MLPVRLCLQTPSHRHRIQKLLIAKKKHDQQGGDWATPLWHRSQRCGGRTQRQGSLTAGVGSEHGCRPQHPSPSPSHLRTSAVLSSPVEMQDGSAKPSWHIIRLPLEQGKAAHSSAVAWRIPWTVHGSQSRHGRALSLSPRLPHFAKVRHFNDK